MKKILAVLRHPIDHAMLFVARRPDLKRRLRGIVSRLPFLYGWLLARRRRQLLAQISASQLEGLESQRTHRIEHLEDYFIVPTVRTTDDILMAIRREIGQPQGEVDGR